MYWPSNVSVLFNTSTLLHGMKELALKLPQYQFPTKSGVEITSLECIFLNDSQKTIDT